MASIKLRIEVNPNGETEFGKNDGVEKIGNIVNDNAELSNVSYKTEVKNNQDVFNITTINENGRNALSWANNNELQFDDEDCLSLDGLEESEIEDEQDPDMFVWGAVPESKQYSVKLTFSNATSLKDIVVYGDKTANQFPTKAIIDGTKTIYSDDYQWAINMETESGTHTIEFVEWNRANYNACLTRIMVMLRYFDLDKGWIESVESLTQSTSDASSLNYGILANSGSATISDLNGEIEDYVRDGIMPSSNLDVKLLVNGNQIQEHIISDSDYDITKKEFSVSMTNKLTDLGVLKYKGFIYQGEPISLYDLLTDIMSSLTTQAIDSMMSSDIKSALQKITVEYPAIEYGKTYEELLNEICTLAQLNMICDEDNNYKFYSARPLYSYDEKIIQIPNSSLVETPNYDLILKNKYDGVEISENLVSYEDASIYTSDSLTIYNKRTYIANDDNVNPPDYTIYRYEMEYFGYVLIMHEVDLDEIVSQQKQAFDPNTTDDIKININLLNAQYALRITGSGISLSSQYFSVGQVSRIEKLTPVNNHSEGALDVIVTKINNTNKIRIHIFLQEDRLSGGYTAGTYYETFTQSVTFDVIKRCLIYKNKSASSPNIENCKTKATVSTSGKLLQTGTKIGDVKLSDYIKGNILSDYSNGVSTGSVNLFPTNLYYIDGTLAKNFKNGEILNAGDLIKFNDIDKVWRVTGRKFTYDGEPLVNVEYQEFKTKIESTPIDYFEFEEGVLKGLSDNGKQAYNNNMIDILVIPSSYTLNNEDIVVSEISDKAFYNLTKLKAVLLPKTLKKLGYVFDEGLRYVFYDGSIDDWFGIDFNDSIITTSLLTVYFESFGSSGEDGNNAFLIFNNKKYYKITNIVTPKNITRVKQSTFSCFYQLKSVKLDDNISRVDKFAFYRCSHITSLTISNIIESIGIGAFAYCRSLKTLDIPASIKYISSTAFDQCSNLSNITIRAEDPPLLGDNYSIPQSIQSIYVPSSSVNNYKTAPRWSNYSDKIYAIGE